MDLASILYSEISFKPASQSLTSSSQASSSPVSSYDGCAPTNGLKNGATNSHNANNNNCSLNNGHQSLNNNRITPSEEFKPPKVQICDPNLVELDWSRSERVGGGLINVGNTCFLNSVLQCLTYCPPLYNFLVRHDGGHSRTCKLSQFCMLCEMEKHMKRIRASNGAPIKPVSIVQRLKYINKNFQFGRQEDAHEFLRYLIDHMWKACLLNFDINIKSNKLDPRIKETTVINHIFGGYHRSQVLCLSCNSRSNTFDFFMDFILDIRNARSLEEALRRFTQPETLENENAYKCSKCRKKVTARKKFTVYKAPNVATFQLKRFDSDRMFGKVTKHITYPEEFDLRPYMSDTSKTPIRYQLSAVLVHVGHSSNSGHYFCFIKNSNKIWYRMDDSSVTISSQNTVLQQQAYVLFYTRKASFSIAYHRDVESSLTSTSTTPNGSSTINNLNASINSTGNHNSYGNHSNHNSIHNNHKIHINHNNSHNNLSGQAINNNNHSNHDHHNKSPKIPRFQNQSPRPVPFTTWQGSKSQLNDIGKRKADELTERDKFNEELDQGKLKKIKSFSRDRARPIYCVKSKAKKDKRCADPLTWS